MNPIEYDIKRQRNIELLVLIISTVYMIGFTILITANQWGSWDLVTIVVFTVLGWMFYLTSYKDYRFRAYLTFGMIQMAMVLYTLNLESIVESFTTMIALTIIILLYSIPELIIITLVAYTFEILYHTFVTKSICFVGGMEDCRNIFLILTVYFVQFVIYYALSRQSEISQMKDERIEELKIAERSKDDFLANVSHEIRTPINTICGMSETVLRENLPDKVREDIFDIQTAGQNLLSVVSDILDFSELQADNVELVEEVYNVSYLANDIINMSMAKRKEKKIELIVNLEAGMPSELIGDEQKIRRVIVNLVNNAIKFTSEGGVSISFSCRREEYGVNLTVTVKDTGIGMKPDRMEKIFTMFSQIDSKRNRQEGGIGLGLAISKAIVAQMGGFISVNSEYDKGTTIQFTIPQKVANWNPVAVVENAAMLNAAVYINMEQFGMVEIRDEYSANIQNMITQLNINCHICQNLPELKRRLDREYLTHVFISISEYREDPAFFVQLAEQAKVFIIMERSSDTAEFDKKLIRIYKPFFLLSIVMALNGENTSGNAGLHPVPKDQFIAPAARILAVDDNLMNLKVIENLLKPYEVQVVSVTSGTEAIECIGTKDFDLVFMDHMMPEMDGIETFKRIRNKPGQYYKRVPIVALTANAVSGMREMFLKEGFDGFVSKPVELSALDRVLRRYIPEYKVVRKEQNESKETNVMPNIAAGDYGDGDLMLQDLDVEKGMMYCGGREGYIDVLRLHSTDGEKNKEQIEEFYEHQNWKDYGIYVHALKSSMMSIGAVHLSEMAKKLEAAAKENNQNYILSAHAQAMKEYERVLGILKASPALQNVDTKELPKPEEKPAETAAGNALEEISEAELESRITQFEDAVYALDKETMNRILDELEAYQYHGHAFSDMLEAIRRKVGMDDYMSAFDALAKLRNKWSKD